MNKRTEIENLYERYSQLFQENLDMIQKDNVGTRDKRHVLMDEVIVVSTKIENMLDNKVFVSVKGVCLVPTDRGLEVMEVYT